MSAVTQWFDQWADKDVKPAHVGVYQVEPDSSCQDWYAYFDGEEWGWMDVSPQKALTWHLTSYSRHSRMQWRGLAEKPA